MSQKFKSDIEAQAGIRDSSGAIGTSGQVLSSTGSNVSWINQTTVASDVQNLVKAGVAINKGQAVYVTGADGTNIIVGLASNVAEATSSKTLGLLDATVSINGFANVVQIGKLAGLNTTAANQAGDPVWLGENGNLIYGLTNKPYAPDNLVFIGIVTRVNANNGEIFINVQNGFELNEIHDVDLKTNVPVNGDILGYDGTLWVNKTIAEWLGYTPANASGTTNYVSKFTGATTLGNSIISEVSGVAISIAGNVSVNGNWATTYPIYQMIDTRVGGAEWNIENGRTIGNLEFYNGAAGGTKLTLTPAGNVGIGTSAPSQKLEVIGSTKISQSLTIGTSGNYEAGSIYSDTNWGMIFRARQASPNNAQFMWADSLDNELMRIKNGNVGIGTTSPSEKLDINGSARIRGNGFLYFDTTGATSSNYIGVTNDFWTTITCNRGNYSRIDLTNASGILFSESGSERMRINAGGNVGIGTTSPGEKLTILSSTINTNTVLVQNTSGTGVNYGLEIKAGTNSVDHALQVLNSSGGSLLRVRGDGNVGIGTTSPAYKLQVVNSGNTLLQLNGNNTAGTVDTGFTISADDSKNIYLYQRENASTVFGTNNAERMRITSNGNVGIGTTTPLNNAGSTAMQIVGADYPLFTITSSNQSINTQLGVGFNSGYAGTSTNHPFNIITNGNLSTSFASNGAIRFNNYGSGTFTGTATQRLAVDSSGNVIEIPIGGGAVDGSGTTNYVTKWTDADTIGNSQIFDNGANVGIGTNIPSAAFQVGNGTGLKNILISGSGNNLGLGGLSVTFLGFTTGTISTVNTSGAVPLGVGTRSTQPLVLGTNNAERMRIDSSGNVGIGTTAPQAKLHINNGTDRNLWFRVNGSGTGTELLSINDAQSTRQSLAFSASSFYFDNGNVGIGTTSPSSKLTVDAGDVTLTNGNLYVAIGSGNNYSSRLSTALNYPNVDTYLDSIGGGGWEGRLNFRTSSNGGSLTTKMTITDSGNVGIGTTSPQKNLHIKSTNGSATAQLKIESTGTPRAYLGMFGDTLYINSGGTFDSGWSLDGSVGVAGIELNSFNGGSQLIFATASSNTAPTERMRITSSGNVGIGTTTPGVKLEVQGSAITDSAIRIKNTGSGGIAWDMYSTNNSFAQGAGKLLFYRPADGNSATMTLDSGGNVGIGTTDVDSRFKAELINVASLRVAYNGASINYYDANENIFRSGSGSERMRITASGNVGIGTTSPNPSALLHLKSTTQGFLPPVMRTGERNGISSPAIGLMIFNEEDDAVQVYTGEGWRTLAWL